MTATVGFAVVYRFRIKPGMEAPFQQGWERITQQLMQQRGALGSRLHRASDGLLVAYAQWPSREAWQSSRDLGTVDAEASQMMRDATVESLEPMLLTPTVDHLQHVAIAPQD